VRVKARPLALLHAGPQPAGSRLSSQIMYDLIKQLLNRVLLPAILSVLVFLVGKGWITSEESNQIAAAVTLLVVNVAIGLTQKFIQTQKVQTALELPANSSKDKLKKEIDARGDLVSILSKIFS
jgi:hypothetical protein